MSAKNDITGDVIQSKPGGEGFRSGWDRIWGKKETTDHTNLTDGDDDTSEDAKSGDDLSNVKFTRPN